MNSLKFHSFLLLLLVYTCSWGQEVLVLDGVSQFPLEGVALYNTQRTAAILTNSEGKAPLELFSTKDTLMVQFYGFESLQINLSSKELKNGFTLVLQPKDQTLEEVILSVGRNPTTRKQIAEKVVVIDAQTIALQRPLTGAELISLSPGVRIQK